MYRIHYINEEMCIQGTKRKEDIFGEKYTFAGTDRIRGRST